MDQKFNPVVHFEMPYEDRERAAKFYGDIFGWKAQMMGPEMGSYVVMHTAEMGENNMVKNPGQINGGMFKKSPENSAPSVVIAVADVRGMMQKVEAAGGKIVGVETPGEPMDIPGIGL